MKMRPRPEETQALNAWLRAHKPEPTRKLSSDELDAHLALRRHGGPHADRRRTRRRRDSDD